MGDSRGIMDPERMASFRELGGGDDSLILELLEIYIQSAAGEIAGCEASFAEKDIQTLRTHLHTLKGSTLNMGLGEMYEGVESLHQDVKNGRFETFQERIGRMRRFLEKVRHFRDELLGAE